MTQDNWIDANERLPDSGVSVLVAARHDTGSYMLVAHWDEEYKTWLNDEDYDDIIYPVYWQPLPELPIKLQ